MKVVYFAGLALLVLTLLSGCSEPPVPPEVQLALSQKEDLRRAGAHVYAPGSYAEFLAKLQSGRDRLAIEQARLSWLRDYESVAEHFRGVMARGELVRKEVARKQADQTRELHGRSLRITERLQALRDLSVTIKDSRLNTGNLSRIDVLLAEAGRFVAGNQPELALERLSEADALVDKTAARIRPILSQYIDASQIAQWKAQVDEVIAESRRKGGHAIVVNKLRRQLVLYHKGVAVANYPVGLGFRPVGDKLYAGDRATPEGRYEVVSKLPNSKYYRALLINYPNAEDRKRFAEAKRRKQIPANARIGGLIEIHGGGKEGATLGCIGLNDSQMLDLYNLVEVGTPVVIVAAMNNDNLVRIALGKLE